MYKQKEFYKSKIVLAQILAAVLAIFNLEEVRTLIGDNLATLIISIIPFFTSILTAIWRVKTDTTLTVTKSNK